MERREFVGRTIGVGFAASLAASASADGAGGDEAPVEKVKRTMLSMQRASWEQGVAAQALLESGDDGMVVLFAREAVLRQSEDGRLADLGSSDNVTDPAANGPAVLHAARITGDARLAEGARRMADYLLEKAPRTAAGVLHHLKSVPQVWVDSIYMAPPFLALAGRPDEAVRQIQGMRRLLWNAEQRLFSHIWDDGRQVFARKDFWGVGNGWAAAGMTCVLEALPPEMRDEKKLLAAGVRDVLDGCLAHQRSDGLFHNVVDDGGSFVETNLAQMLSYVIYRGLRGGWLDETYRSRAEKMRRAAHAKVDAFGFVRDVCGSPRFDSKGTATEGQAFFLLMEAARKELLEQP